MSWFTRASRTSEVKSILAGRRILDQTRPGNLSRFDAGLHGRSWTAPEWFPSLWDVEPTDVRKLARLSGDAEATAVILASHPSGWVRQAALPLLEEASTPLALAMLVLRSNDWVEPIRGDAQARLRRVAVGEDVQCFASVLPEVEQLAMTASRSAAFARVFLEELTGRLTATTLESGLRDSSVRVRRSSARLLASKGLARAVLDSALEQDDAVTACIVAEAAALIDASRALSERLTAARSGRLRWLGLRRLTETGGVTAEEAARRALLDRHVHVRSEAQRFLSRYGVAVNHVYAGLLEAFPAVAILGLAETGTEADASRVIPFASHASPRVRDAVCMAITKLDPKTYRHTLLALVHDSSPRVAGRAAAAIVRSNADAAELDHLWSLVAAPSGRRAVLTAFESLDRWVQLIYAFRSISTDLAREEGVFLLERVMARWNTSFTTPAPDRARELGSLLPSVLSRLEPKPARELELIVSLHLRRYLR